MAKSNPTLVVFIFCFNSSRQKWVSFAVEACKLKANSCQVKLADPSLPPPWYQFILTFYNFKWLFYSYFSRELSYFVTLFLLVNWPNWSLSTSTDQLKISLSFKEFKSWCKSTYGSYLMLVFYCRLNLVLWLMIILIGYITSNSASSKSYNLVVSHS